MDSRRSQSASVALRANRGAIATMLRDAAADGLTPELLAPEVLFA